MVIAIRCGEYTALSIGNAVKQSRYLNNKPSINLQVFLTQYLGYFDQ